MSDLRERNPQLARLPVLVGRRPGGHRPSLHARRGRNCQDRPTVRGPAREYVKRPQAIASHDPRGTQRCRCPRHAIRPTGALDGLAPRRPRVASLADALANMRVVVLAYSGKQEQNGEEKNQHRGLTAKGPARARPAKPGPQHTNAQPSAVRVGANSAANRGDHRSQVDRYL